MNPLRSSFDIVKHAPDLLRIRDDDNGRTSVLDDAENVVAHLRDTGWLKPGMRLECYDSQGHLDEIVFDERGVVGLLPVASARPLEEGHDAG